MKQPLPWVPWRVDSWLFGSSRHELSRAQRADFLDLVLLAAKDSGHIRANETTPYPIAQLAGLLCVEPAELEETIEVCIRVGKITRLENRTLYVSSWERYRLTPQYRRKLERGSSPDPSSKRRVEESKGEEIKGKGNTVSQKGNSSPPPSDKDDGEGLLPIPKGLPFDVQDELIKRRGEIGRLTRMIKAGCKQDGPNRLTPEILEQHKKAFKARVGDFLP